MSPILDLLYCHVRKAGLFVQRIDGTPADLNSFSQAEIRYILEEEGCVFPVDLIAKLLKEKPDSLVFEKYSKLRLGFVGDYILLVFFGCGIPLLHRIDFYKKDASIEIEKLYRLLVKGVKKLSDGLSDFPFDNEPLSDSSIATITRKKYF